MSSPRKIVVFLGAATLLGAAGCGAVAHGQSAAGSAAVSGQAAAPASPDPGALAAKLRVSQAKLQGALAAIRPPRGSGSPSVGGLAATLAKRLGLPPGDVQAALDAVMPRPAVAPGRGPRAPPG